MAVDILIGGQYGSEGKGVVAAEIAPKYVLSVRVGGPNAGHSFVHKGKLWKMQALPVNWVNPNAKLAIGPGAVINLSVLEREIEAVSEVDPDIRERLFIDPRAGVIDPHHVAEEGHTTGEIHKRIGSTGEGIGAARRDRMARGAARFVQVKDRSRTHLANKSLGSYFADIPQMIADTPEVLLEGTQGFGLSLIHGEWPYVTSADTTAAQLAADCGCPLGRVRDVIMVVRSYPIRVAGNSGPMQGEVSWDQLSARLGREVEERTTVTKKVRRIAAWDDGLFDRAVLLNAPTKLVLTFADYMDDANYTATSWDDLTVNTRAFVKDLETRSGAPVIMVGTGFDELSGWSYVDRR